MHDRLAISSKQSTIWLAKNAFERGHIKRSFLNNADDLHFSPSCSMVVTLHGPITSPAVFAIRISILKLATSEPHVGTVKHIGNYTVAPVDWIVGMFHVAINIIKYHPTTLDSVLYTTVLHECFKHWSRIYGGVVVVLT